MQGFWEWDIGVNGQYLQIISSQFSRLHQSKVKAPLRRYS